MWWSLGVCNRKTLPCSPDVCGSNYVTMFSHTHGPVKVSADKRVLPQVTESWRLRASLINICGKSTVDTAVQTPSNYVGYVTAKLKDDAHHSADQPVHAYSAPPRGISLFYVFGFYNFLRRYKQKVNYGISRELLKGDLRKSLLWTGWLLDCLNGPPSLCHFPEGGLSRMLIGVDSLRVSGQPVFYRTLCVFCERSEFWKSCRPIWRI